MNKITKTLGTIMIASCFLAMAVGSGTESTDTASKVGEVTESSKSDTSSEANDKIENSTPAEAEQQAKTESETQAETENTAAKDKYAVGDIVETKRLRISYLSCGEFISDNQFIQPKDGNKFIYCEFEFENISNSDEFVSSWDFDCFADDNSCDACYYGDDELSATISSGRKTKGKVYFEVPQNAQNIEIEYEVNWVTSGKIIFQYQ